MLDRAHTDLDNIFHSLDSDPETEPLQASSPPTSSPLRSAAPASTSDTNTSDRTNAPNNHHPSSSSVDLSEILLNIKSGRWRHFRPRTLSHHPLGGDISRYRGFRGFTQSTSLGQIRLLGSGANALPRTGPGATPVTGELCSSCFVVYARIQVLWATCQVLLESTEGCLFLSLTTLLYGRYTMQI